MKKLQKLHLAAPTLLKKKQNAKALSQRNETCEVTCNSQKCLISRCFQFKSSTSDAALRRFPAILCESRQKNIFMWEIEL